MVLPGKTRSGGGERVSRQDNEVEGEGNLIEAGTTECPAVSWKVKSLGVKGAWILIGDLRTGTHLARVAKSTRRICAQGWRTWMSWRIMRGKETGWG